MRDAGCIELDPMSVNWVNHGECDSRERRGMMSAHRRAAGKRAGAFGVSGQPANAMGGGAAGRTNKGDGMSVDDVAAGRTVFGEVPRARQPRARLVTNPVRFVRGECLACGHVGIVNRRMLFERVLTCAACGAAGLPRIVERGG